MELKNINVIQGQAGTFQGFGCAVCWSEIVKKKLLINFVLLSASNADLCIQLKVKKILINSP